MTKRRHRAEATRVLAAGVSASAMLGIVTALATQTPVPAAAGNTTPNVPTAAAESPASPGPPLTIHQLVTQHLPAPASGSTATTPSARRTASSGAGPSPVLAPGSAPAPAPAPTPAPKPAPVPVTTTKGS